MELLAIQLASFWLTTLVIEPSSISPHDTVVDVTRYLGKYLGTRYRHACACP